jgi:acetyltransferase-like isoleucine patch superfamily enzyme
MARSESQTSMVVQALRSQAEKLLFRRWSGVLSRLRVSFYRILGMRIGQGCRLEAIRVRRAVQIELGTSNSLTKGCWLWPADQDTLGTRIKIGSYNYFNRDVMIDACNYIQIGDRNMIGPGVFITDSNHTMPQHGWVADAPMDLGVVTIGDGCWIGAHASILKDVTLGDRCVVAAGAVVTRSFPEGAVIGGVPARLLKVPTV